jgi:hypothetical protein
MKSGRFIVTTALKFVAGAGIACRPAVSGFWFALQAAALDSIAGMMLGL